MFEVFASLDFLGIWRTVLFYSDLTSGALGILGSLFLAYPLLSEIADRRHWDLLTNFRRQQLLSRGSKRPMTAEEIQAYRDIRDNLIDQRLGEHQKYRRFTLWGFFCLLGSFIFMSLASYERSSAFITHLHQQVLR
jgi:hypothetical protein